MTDAEASNRPSTWIHYRARLFGIDDLLLPPNHDLKPNPEENSEYTIVGNLADQSTLLKIELLYDSTQVDRAIDLLKTLCNIDPADEYTQVVEPLGDIDFGIPHGAAHAKACAIHVKPFGDMTPEVTYHVVLQSPFAHGLRWEFRGPLADLDAIRASARHIISSLKWIDRRLVTKDISPQLVGSWCGDQPLPEYLANPGCRASETMTVVYQADGRYAASKVMCHVRKDTGAKTTEASKAMPGGTYRAFRAEEDGSVQVVTVGDEFGVVTVRNVMLVSDGDVMEFEGEIGSLRRVKEKSKQSFFKRAGRKLFK